MVELSGLRHFIAMEFSEGLSAKDNLREVGLEGLEEESEMIISPELAADFEVGLESEIGASCGCGCGHSCSGTPLESPADGCSGCHHHG